MIKNMYIVNKLQPIKPHKVKISLQPSMQSIYVWGSTEDILHILQNSPFLDDFKKYDQLYDHLNKPTQMVGFDQELTRMRRIEGITSNFEDVVDILAFEMFKVDNWDDFENLIYAQVHHQ